jgi:ABC-type dipeptide/oligopeptide/nickel transport system permease subunit
MRPERQNTYFQLIWSRFSSDHVAYWSLWGLALLTVLAIAAPLLASNQPFVYWDDDELAFPWLRSLFANNEPVNFVFNMNLITLLFGMPVIWLFNRLARRRNLSRRRRIRYGIWMVVGATLFLTALFSLPAFRPAQRYATRSFVTELHEDPDHRHAVFAWIPFGPIEQDLQAIFKAPMYRKPVAEQAKSNDASPHLLGTDNTGRDVLVQMIYGTRISITVGFLAVGLYATIGSLVGAFAAYFGGTVDMITSRLIEIVLLFPAFFLTLTLVALLGPSIYIIMFVIGITGWPTVARLTRGEVMQQRSLDYVTSARAAGASHLRIVLRHLLPNALGPTLVAIPFGVAGAIMTEAGLSLLGFGVRPPTPSWGSLLRLGSANYNYWWLVVFPSLAIFSIVTLFNLVGNGVRDAMDPKATVDRF